MAEPIDITLNPPDTFACPVCDRMSLDYDMRPKIACEKTTMFGMFALEIKVKHKPVIFCTYPTCDFVQWGRVDGMFAVFDGTPDAG